MKGNRPKGSEDQGKSSKNDLSNGQKQRNRYILFQLGTCEHISRKDMIRGIRDSFRDAPVEPPWLMRFNGRFGIVRCSHLLKDDTVRSMSGEMTLNGTAVNVETHLTSGTIKALLSKADARDIEHGLHESRKR